MEVWIKSIIGIIGCGYLLIRLFGLIKYTWSQARPPARQIPLPPGFPGRNLFQTEN